MTADNQPTGEAIVSRYSKLARAALAGEAITDCEPGAFAGGCFGAAAYPEGSADLDTPEAALRASLGCGNPIAVAGLKPGETVLDLPSCSTTRDFDQRLF